MFGLHMHKYEEIKRWNSLPIIARLAKHGQMIESIRGMDLDELTKDSIKIELKCKICGIVKIIAEK